MTNNKFDQLFGSHPRRPESPLTQRDMDIAASIQSVTEELVIKIAKNIANDTGLKNLCLAGGVALNCVANGKLFKENIFDSIWVQPAAGDAGGALGAALAVYYGKFKIPRIPEKNDSMMGSFLGPQYTPSQIRNYLDSVGAIYHEIESSEVFTLTAEYLSQGLAIGWFSGRMEFGPRSLGARSILADPRSENMQKNLNLKVKFRESFRPFAPCVLAEDASKWFDFSAESPYMLMVAEVRQQIRKSMTSSEDLLFGIDKLNVSRSSIPAVTHVDYSARIQTVDEGRNKSLYKLLNAFKQLTGCPVLVNTSFNVRGEPIVMSPEDAYRCFMGTGLDVLVIENFIMLKNGQPKDLIGDYSSEYELD
jgi:carbamoyltransferase